MDFSAEALSLLIATSCFFCMALVELTSHGFGTSGGEGDTRHVGLIVAGGGRSEIGESSISGLEGEWG